MWGWNRYFSPEDNRLLNCKLLGQDNFEHFIRMIFEVLSAYVAENGAISWSWEIKSGLNIAQAALSPSN
jgi:hypothetical protein